METLKTLEKTVVWFEDRADKASYQTNITAGHYVQLDKSYDEIRDMLADTFAISQSHAANTRLQKLWDRLERAGRRLANVPVEY